MSDRLRKLLESIIVIVAVTFSSLLGATAHAAAAPPEGADTAVVVTAWNAIALRTIVIENRMPMTSSGLYLGLTSIAVFDAVAAIEGGHQPYVYQGRAPKHASAAVAAAAAAHRILAHYFPASTAALDADYTAFLVGIPNGSAKTAGQRVGEASAAAVTAAVRPTPVTPLAPTTSTIHPAPTVLPHPDSHSRWCPRWLPCAR